MIEDTFVIEGSPCQGYRFMPDDGAPKAILHIVHGLAEHALRYRPLAEALTADGWGVYAHDHRGHGATAPSDEALGFFADDGGWDLVVEDLGKLVAHEKAQHAGCPFVLFGHSMGSFAVQDYISRPGAESLTAVVLSGVAGPPPPIATVARGLARVERWRQGKKGRSALLRKASFDDYNRQFRPNRTAADWLSKDPSEVDKYIEDPKCGFEGTNQLWIDLLDALSAMFASERLANIDKGTPIYIFAGDADPVGRSGKGVRALADALRGAGVKRVDMKLYPTGRHEMLNEINREEVVMDLKAWLAEAALPAEK